MDTIRQSIQVEDDGASSTIDKLKEAWQSYLQEIEQGVGPTQALASAFDGLVSAADGVAPTLDQVRSLMADMGVEANGLGDAQRYAAASMSDLDQSAQGTADSLSQIDQSAQSAAQGLQTTTQSIQDVSTASKDAQTEVKGMGDTFQTMGEVATGNTSGVVDIIKELGPAGAVAGTALAALPEIISTITDTITSMVEAFAEQQTAQVRFDTTLKSSIANYQQYSGVIEGAIKQGARYGFSQEQIQNALGRSIPITKDVGESIKILDAAEDLAAKRGIDLATASQKITIAMETSGAGMRRMGIDVKAHSDALSVLKQISDQVAGQAEAQANTQLTAQQRLDNAKKESMASVSAATADYDTKTKMATAGLYEFIAASNKSGDHLQALGAQLEGMLVNGLTGHILDWTGRLDELANKAKETDTSVSASSNEMTNIVRGNIIAWSDTMDMREAEAAEKTREHMAAVLGYMKISGESGPAGEEGGKAFADFLAATLQIAVDTAHGDMVAIVADLNIAKVAMAELNSVARDASEARDQAAASLANAQAIVARNKQIAADNAAADARENSAHGNVVGGGIYETVGEQNTNLHNAQLAAAAAKKAAQAAGGGGGGGSGPSAETLAKQAAAAAQHLQQLKDTATAEVQAVADKNALAQATDLVTAAQQKQNADSEAAKNTMQGLADEAKKLGQTEADSMLVANTGLKNTQKALDDLRATHQAAIGQMQEELYQYNQQLQKTQEDMAAVIGPLQRVDDAAGAALSAMNAATQAQDRVFTHQQEALAADQRAFDAMAKQIMGPLNDAYDAATARVAALQEAQQAITDLYAKKLLPITQELQDIQNTQAADNRTQGIEDQAKTVANLNAQLANAVVGSKEYNSLLEKRDAAQKLLGQDERVATLTGQQQAIEKQRDAALRANEEQIKQAQAQQKAASEARDAEQKLLDQQKAGLDERMAAAQLEQQLYDQQRRDQAQALTDAKTKADADLKTAQDTWTAKEKIIQDEITKVQERETVYQHDAAAQEATQTALVVGAQASVDQLKVIYGGLHDALTVKTEDVKTYLASVGVVDAANLKDAQTASAQLATSISDRKDAAAAAKALADYSAAYGVSGPTATQALKDATPAFQAAAPAMTAVGNAFKNDLVPAMGGMATQVATPLGNTGQTFLDYFGGQGQSKDLTKSIPWMVDGRNKRGLIASLNFFFDVGLGIDGLKGMTILRMEDWKATFEGYLTAESAIAKTQAAAIGNAIIDGIEVPLADPTKRAALGSAIADAVKAAMTDAQHKLEISSPSKLAGRMLGEPIGSGVAGGITGSGGQVSAALNNVLSHALRSNQAAYGSVPYGGAQGQGYAGGTSTIVLDVRANGVSVGSGLPSVPGLLSPQQIRTVAIEIKRELEMQGIR